MLCCDVNILIIFIIKIKEVEGGASCDDGRGVDRVICFIVYFLYEVECYFDCVLLV